MKLVLIFTFVFILVLTGCRNEDFNSDKNIYDINDKSGEIKAEVKSSLNNDMFNPPSLSDSSNNDINDPIDIYNSDENNVVYKNPNELSNFSTKILTNDNNRYNNICIVSDRLNNFVLDPRRNFFF